MCSYASFVSAMAFIGLMGLIIWVGATNQVTGPAGIQTPGVAHAGELFTERLHWSSSALLTCASTCVCVCVCVLLCVAVAGVWLCVYACVLLRRLRWCVCVMLMVHALCHGVTRRLCQVRVCGP